uniref:ANK_REP_REGION domain-containing protein n=1 Tax=Macrostomum lignano TaxID=282301 RepID=A0A1I8FJL5_9PLAT
PEPQLKQKPRRHLLPQILTGAPSWTRNHCVEARSGSASVQISPKPEDADLKELFNRQFNALPMGTTTHWNGCCRQNRRFSKESQQRLDRVLHRFISPPEAGQQRDAVDEETLWRRLLQSSRRLETIRAYYAAHNPNETTFKWMLHLKQACQRIFILGNISNTNALHACAKSVQAVESCEEATGNWTLPAKGSREGLMVRIAFGPFETVLATSASLGAISEGRTAVHCAAPTRHVCQGSGERLSLVAKRGGEHLRVTLSSADDEGRNPVFIACLLKNFDFLSADFIKPKRQACMDQKGNTLLHASAQSARRILVANFDVENFFVEFEHAFQTEGGIYR